MKTALGIIFGFICLVTCMVIGTFLYRSLTEGPLTIVPGHIPGPTPVGLFVVGDVFLGWAAILGVVAIVSLIVAVILQGHEAPPHARRR